MSTRLPYITFLLGIGLSCTSRPATQSQESLGQEAPITYSVDELDRLYRPLRRDTFILSVGHDEFRAPIEDLFSAEERRAHKIQILEYTWGLDQDSLLTVWYLPLSDSLRVLGLFTYPRDAVF
jgi:lipoprotein